MRKNVLLLCCLVLSLIFSTLPGQAGVVLSVFNDNEVPTSAIALPFSAADALYSYYDLKPSIWGYKAMTAMAGENILPSYSIRGNRFFLPNMRVSRGELAVILVKFKDIPLQSYDSYRHYYDDILGNELADTDILAATKAGIFKPGPDFLFRPKRYVTRQEAAGIFTSWGLPYKHIVAIFRSRPLFLPDVNESNYYGNAMAAAVQKFQFAYMGKQYATGVIDKRTAQALARQYAIVLAGESSTDTFFAREDLPKFDQEQKSLQLGDEGPYVTVFQKMLTKITDQTPLTEGFITRADLAVLLYHVDRNPLTEVAKSPVRTILPKPERTVVKPQKKTIKTAVVPTVQVPITYISIENMQAIPLQDELQLKMGLMNNSTANTTVLCTITIHDGAGELLDDLPSRKVVLIKGILNEQVFTTIFPYGAASFKLTVSNGKQTKSLVRKIVDIPWYKALPKAVSRVLKTKSDEIVEPTENEAVLK
jgi:hypothetical protein